MRTQEKRFVDGKKRTWQIICSQCRSASKTIGSNKRSSLPPNIIIKKLSKAGWLVGSNPKQDLCPECIGRPIKARIAIAQQALNDLAAPMVTINGSKRVHFTELKIAASALDAERAKELIEMLKKQIPPKPEKKPKAQRAATQPPMAQAEYETWLTNLEQLEKKR